MAHMQRDLDPPLAGMATGRIVLGVLGLLIPRTLVRMFGLPPSPELTYMTRVFGARAVALGAGYLTEPAGQRLRWHRLGLFVDTADTLGAVGHLVRRDLPRPAVLALGGLTGCYMLTGAVRLITARDPEARAPRRRWRHGAVNNP
jgi:hypothetical protein